MEKLELGRMASLGEEHHLQKLSMFFNIEFIGDTGLLHAAEQGGQLLHTDKYGGRIYGI